jgi:hypothetical protein
MAAILPPKTGRLLDESDKRVGVFGLVDDPTKRVVGMDRYERPTLRVPNGITFEWPIGVEGIRFAGSATMAEHKYIGDNDVVLQVTHGDDQRITMTGQFPGLTGHLNMERLMAVCRAPTPAKGKILHLPKGVFSHEIRVKIDSYDFDHPEDDRNASWNYTIVMRRIALGRAVKSPPRIQTHPSRPAAKGGKAKGKGHRVFTVHKGANTLRSISKIVYGNPSKWQTLFNKNRTALLKLHVPFHRLPMKRLPLGMKITY